MNIPQRFIVPEGNDPEMRPLLVLILLAFLAQPVAGQEKKPLSSPYFPLQVGNQWVYRADNRTITKRVTRHELVGKVLCARLEASGNDKTFVEHVAVRADGIFRYQADGKVLEPPLCLLKLPPKVGATWQVDCRVDGLVVTGTFTLAEVEEAVPAGKFKAVMVTSADCAIDGRKTPMTSWFVKGVGMVKQRVQVNGLETVLELESFTPGK
jgi:hypothetical protein